MLGEKKENIITGLLAAFAWLCPRGIAGTFKLSKPCKETRQKPESEIFLLGFLDSPGQEERDSHQASLLKHHSWCGV